MKYKCPRCDHICDDLTIFNKHINRKHKCISKYGEDIEINIEKCKIISGSICEYCNQEYSNNGNLKKNKKKCKDKDKNKIEYLEDLIAEFNKKLKEYEDKLNSKDKIIEMRDNQINELIQKVGNNTINNNTININGNVLLSLSNSNLEHLTDNDMYACVNSCVLSVPNLIRKIHFNPMISANHNIYITNIRNKYVVVFNGKEWEIKDRRETREDMININEYRLEDWVSNEEVQKMFPKAMKKFELYMKKREEDGVLDLIKNEINMLLYNKKDMIINTSKNMKKLKN